MRRIVLIALVLTAVLAVPVAERRATAAVIPMSVADLALQAPVCLRGQVIDARAAWTPDGAMIYTTYTIQRSETLIGQVPDLVLVRVPGGDLNGIHIRNGEAPSYIVGEEVVCFLEPEAGLPSYRTFGWFQGKFTILGGWVRELLTTPYDSLRQDILEAAANR
ncbi:MAG: hypothetical protein KDB53_01195 [Planctomycetes bacterium]|nr:hypothetical protein [Planctomycetota bacterium]